MVKLKPSCPPEGNKLKIPTDWNKGQASNPKKYKGKKTQNKPSVDPETETDFQGRCTDLEGYTFDLGPRASEIVSITMKELDKYLGTTYSDIYQPDITTETAATLPNPEMPTITDLGIKSPKKYGKINYLEKNNIDEAIRQKLRKKDVYQSDMHKIYNLIVVQTNKQK